ncbi:putative translocon-associated protein subunit alpha [Blattamonas nauphoetae]|uniref:Translocon-associated protein subunit alpha n=1 Tax=Blattamonas nauphoetae TaxID=2049346 RepID=A0ABQ9YJR6_9EUKA|nr:putative translocon-associated protein subunit alpha [Blattamonas nauphoetae]
MGLLRLLLLFSVSSKYLFIHADTEYDDDDDDEESPETRRQKSNFIRETNELLNNVNEPHDNVIVTSKLLPQQSTELIHPGDVVDMLIGFENSGQDTFFVTDLVVAMTDPYDRVTYVRNYTTMHLNVTVNPLEQLTLEYPFMIDPRTNPVEFGVVGLVFYSDLKGREFTSVPCNTTIVIVDKPYAINSQRFVLIIAVLSIAVALIYLSRRAIGDCLVSVMPGQKKNKRKRRSRPMTKEEEEESWRVGTLSASFEKAHKRAVSQSPGGLKRSKRGRSPGPTKLR